MSVVYRTFIYTFIFQVRRNNSFIYHLCHTLLNVDKRVFHSNFPFTVFLFLTPNFKCVCVLVPVGFFSFSVCVVCVCVCWHYNRTTIYPLVVVSKHKKGNKRTIWVWAIVLFWIDDLLSIWLSVLLLLLDGFLLWFWVSYKHQRIKKNVEFKWNCIQLKSIEQVDNQTHILMYYITLARKHILQDMFHKILVNNFHSSSFLLFSCFPFSPIHFPQKINIRKNTI